MRVAGAVCYSLLVVLGMAQSEAVLLSALLGFLIYLGALLWGFTVRAPVRVGSLFGAGIAAPISNWVTTGDHPGRTLSRGLWGVAGMDLLLLLGALVAFVVARRLHGQRALAAVGWGPSADLQGAAPVVAGKAAHG
jgi:hypothetical protein